MSRCKGSELSRIVLHCKSLNRASSKQFLRIRTFNRKRCLGLVGCLLLACFPTSTLVTSFFPHTFSPSRSSPRPQLHGGLGSPKQKYPFTMRLSGGASKGSPKSPPRSPAKNAVLPLSPSSSTQLSAKKSGSEDAKWSVAAAGELEVLSTRESVLKRPDMWIGDVTNVNKSAWHVIRQPVGANPDGTVTEGEGLEGGEGAQEGEGSGKLADGVAKILAEGSNSEGEEELRAVQKEMRYNAGVLKTFDEIIVNSVDRQVEVADMREIRVTIDAASGELCVWNDGPGIEPVPHKSGKGLVPEVAFGEFMASTNFDDQTRQRFTGGRFGVGAKATNAWSKRFRVATLHAASGMEYEQTWTDNMERKTKAKVVKKGKAKQGWTEIRWLPDYERFGMAGLDADTRACMEMRVYDLCACTRETITVSLNGQPLPFRSLAQYARLFWGDPARGGRESVSFVLADKGSGARVEVMLAVSASAALEARGLVNGVQCSQGTHVDHVVTRVADGLTQRAIKQMKKDKIKHDDSRAGLSKMRTYFRQHMAVMLVALLPNPRFDGQTKEKLTLHVKEWGFPATIDDKLIEKIDSKLGLVDKVLLEAEARTMASLAKKGGAPAGSSARVSIAKYQGANLAGKAGRPPCYLLATEGDSAKDLAVAGMEIVGRDCYGVIPLRGVIRNVRPVKVNAKVLKDFLKNAELAAINKVLGLQFGVQYTAANVAKLLRYDHFVIFCDQDPDGAHIAGELINYFTIMFPSLLRAKPDFLMRLGTPIIRLKPKAKGEEPLSFFTTSAFRTWADASGLTSAQLNRRYRMKYLKGLASSNEDDAHYYFQNLNQHLVPIVYSDEADDEIVDKWFRKNRADDRKVLLSRPYDPDVCVDYSSAEVSFPTYFNREYIHFPHYAIYRTIPNVMDGLKPSQRKVLYTAFRRRFAEPVKVVQFAGAVLETAAYHHGDTALQGAIIAMARRYCGSNNVNVLQPDGQFGSRHSNHAGAARYISAGLEKVTRHIFRAEDDAILEYMHEDGQQIEPKFFLPVVPMALINGCEAGIAVGWSSFVPMYNPAQVIDWLRRRMTLSEQEAPDMVDVGRPIPGVIDASLSGQQNRARAAASAELLEVDDPTDATEARGEEEAGGGEGEGVGGGGEGEGEGESGESAADESVVLGAGTKGRKAKADGDGFVDGLVPWYDGFSGEVVRKGPHTFKLRGFAEYFEPERKGGPGIISITEVGPTVRSDALREVWKERFGPAEVKDAKRKKAPEGQQFLKDEQVYNTAVKVHIELSVDPAKLRACAGVTSPSKPLTPDRLEKVLGISETVSTTNMHLFDPTNTMRRFATPEAMLECFFRHRLLAYHRRKQYQVAEMTERVRELTNKARYCTMVHDGELSVVKKTVAQRIADLESATFDKVLPKSTRQGAAAEQEQGEGGDGAGAGEAEGGGFQYLLRVSTLSCTTEHAEKLRREAAGLEGELAVLAGTQPVDMWRRDLSELEAALADFSARKLAALDKGVKTKAPKRKTLKQRNSEKRAAAKAEREEAATTSRAAQSAAKAAQLQARQKRVAARSTIRSPAKAKAKANLKSPASPAKAKAKAKASPAKEKAKAASASLKANLKPSPASAPGRAKALPAKAKAKASPAKPKAPGRAGSSSLKAPETGRNLKRPAAKSGPGTQPKRAARAKDSADGAGKGLGGLFSAALGPNLKGAEAESE